MTSLNQSSFALCERCHPLKHDACFSTSFGRIQLSHYEKVGLNCLDFTPLKQTASISPRLYGVWSKLNGSYESVNYIIMKKWSRLLLARSLIFKHSFTSHSYRIWNNLNLLYEHKSLYFLEIGLEMVLFLSLNFSVCNDWVHFRGLSLPSSCHSVDLEHIWWKTVPYKSEINKKISLVSDGGLEFI